jgi:hypothetical protein
MRRTRCALGATIALASFIALSCNNSYGIFEDIQGQTEQKGSDVFQKTASFTIFRLGSTYYASTARLYARNVDSSTWTQVRIGGEKSYFLRSVVLVNATIYALVGDDSSSVALYSSTDGSSWSKISNLPTTGVLDTLYSANDNLFAISHNYDGTTSTDTGTSYYYLYHYNGSSFSMVKGFTNLTKTIRGVVSDKTDGSAGKYWFASENMIYEDVNPDNSTGTQIFGAPPHTIWYLSYTGGHLYVSMTNGNLYRDGFASFNDVASTPLSVVLQVPSASGNILVVGTDTDDSGAADGYYEGTFDGALNSGNDDSIVAHSSSIYNSTIDGFPVHCFYFDSILQNLFICTSPGSTSSSYYGLYKSHYNGSSWDGWEAE